MKFALATLALLFSTSSFAFVNAGSYEGQGKWKDTAGQVGEWKETHQVEQTDGGTAWTVKLTVLKDGEVVFEELKTSKIVEKTGGFFDVMSGDQVIGKGYCFAKVCHFEAQHPTERVEETLKFTRNGFRKIGSTQGEMNGEAFFVSYEGELRSK